MKNKHFPKGTMIVIEDYDEPVKVLDYRKRVIKKTTEARKKVYGFRYTVYEYAVKDAQGNRFWVDHAVVLGSVKYQPVVMESAVRHMEIAQELFGYETMRDFIETVKPRNRAEKIALLNIKQLLEHTALLYEGTSKEASDARVEIEGLIR